MEKLNRGAFMGNIKKLTAFLFIAFLLIPAYYRTVYAEISDQAKICLTCHAGRGMTKTLENKEILPLFVDKEQFSLSVHKSIDCNGCHTGYMAAHVSKKKTIKSKKDYTQKASQVCSTCHLDDQLKKIPLHASLMKQGTCVECHGSHYIKSMKDWKKDLTETEYCFTCHESEISKRLESGESLSLRVNKSAYKNSIHGTLSCSSCHPEFSKTKHPVRSFKSKNEYTALATKACSTCHTDEQLKKSPIHGSLMAKASCVECHGSHSVRGIKVAKATADETQYCLSCHRGSLGMTMTNGERLSVYVDGASMKNSAHGSLLCTACHNEFSKSQHPMKRFESIRAYTLAGAKLCSKCHPDAYTQYENSIHYTLFKAGNKDAPNCTDCHGSAHSVVRTKTDKTIGLTSCNKCHAEWNSSYEASVHNRARLQGVKDAPVCSSCHNAHDIQSTKMSTQIKEGCFKCHKDMGKVHSKWLKNPPVTLSTFVGAHFEVVSCAACHSPDAQRVISLNMFDCKTGKPLTEEEVAKHLGTDTSGLMKKIDMNSNGVIDASELWDLFAELIKNGVWVTFTGKMDVSSSAEAHQLGAKTEATRNCETCHHPDSEYFKNVVLVMSTGDGDTTALPADSGVLQSIYSIVPVRKFYAIGGTNINLFDLLFYIALIGGLAVPIGHISIRILFTPIRSLRKMGKGGKKK
jgi:predicted CXXCH cytochrome family protein